MASVENILGTYLHVRDGGSTQAIPVDETFWGDVAGGKLPELDKGRLMSAFTFSEPWPTWERHPAGEELVMLLSGAATVVLELGDGERAIELRSPGEFVLVPSNTWHTARTTVATTMLFLTPGAGTEHRPAEA
jgi:mannose-6-phosphate isomerase-like protein (cupin superfamily)